MKKWIALTGLMIGIFSWLISCRKETFIESPEARLRISIDTLRFDTVFTTTGSITGTVKVFNDNDQKLKLSYIRMGGGQSSYFRMNADGTEAQEVRDLEILANDSLYLFVAVTINPNADRLPFLVEDSILIGYNGNEQKIQLEAYGQNANFIRNGFLTVNTQFTNELPYVILGGLVVDTNITLTIDKGARLHFHADAPLVIDGTLKVNGTIQDKVIFTGDRLDEEYRNLPASWPGAYFRSSSKNNLLQYAVIQNAYQGLVAVQPSVNANPKLTLQECIIDNIYDAGIYGIQTSIQASNCLVSNCGVNLLLVSGGNYQFTHCTIASFSNNFVLHKKPVLFLNNWDSSQAGISTFPLTANFINNIFWGDNGTVENEVFVTKRGNNPFNVLFSHNLYKAIQDPAFSTLTANIKNLDPLFDSVNTGNRYFNFRLQNKPSPAINKGIPAGITADLDGKPRDGQPDMGAYEKD
ncbi:MAG: choice-of-anchor Q domain-containing protein [Chitinophagaceae bacterium]